MNTPVRSSKCASCPFSLASTQSSGGRDVGMGRDARATDVSDWPWLRRRRPRCMCCELLVLPLTCCACNQIEWLLALSALWNSGAAGGGACSVVVGLRSLTSLQCAPPAAHTWFVSTWLWTPPALGVLGLNPASRARPAGLAEWWCSRRWCLQCSGWAPFLGSSRAHSPVFVGSSARARSPPGRRPRRLQPCNDPGRPLRSHGRGRPLPCHAACR